MTHGQEVCKASYNKKSIIPIEIAKVALLIDYVQGVQVSRAQYLKEIFERAYWRIVWFAQSQASYSSCLPMQIYESRLLHKRLENQISLKNARFKSKYSYTASVARSRKVD
jgi:hypothetical protein